MALVRKTTAPNLPLGPDLYDRHYIDRLLATQRIYFNQIDNAIGQVVGIRGGGYLDFPYAAVQRTTNVTFTANTPTQITLDTNDFLNGCSNNGTDGIHVAQSGVYNYQLSVQFANMDTQVHTAWIWLRINGVDVAGTNSKWDIPSKHGSSDGYLIAAVNFYVGLQAGDSVEMWAVVSDANVFMVAYPAQTVPFAMPSIPSVVATLTFVSVVA